MSVDLISSMSTTFFDIFGGPVIGAFVLIGIVVWFMLKTRMDRVGIVVLGLGLSYTLHKAGIIGPLLFYGPLIVAAVLLARAILQGGGDEG